MKFTPEQSRVVRSHGRNICVSAGAGSGKTAVLVHRFVDEIISHGACVDEILAITFTNKAAYEMKRRLAAELARPKLASHIRNLENAYISTIDSFCARMLKENPVEAGVDPAFTVVEENDKRLAMERILSDTLEQLWPDPLVKMFLYSYSIDAVVRTVKDVYHEIRISGRSIPASFENGGGPSPIESCKDLKGVAGDILAWPGRDVNAGDRALISNMRTFVDALDRLAQEDTMTWDDIEHLKRLSKDGAIRLPRARKDVALRELVLRFRDERDRFISVLIEEKGKDAREALKRIITAFDVQYGNWKAQHLYLDFEDLLQKAWGLLQRERGEAASLYRNKFKLIMVDEFQDTGPMQDRMVDALSNGRNIFLVGDEKQAIYGFRNADVRIFMRRIDAFSQDTPEGGVLTLSQNFRSRDRIIGFINDFFEDVWPDECEARPYVPLRADRETSNRFVQSDQPCVECVFPAGGLRTDEESSIQVARVREAHMVAARLSEMVEAERRVIYDKTTGRLRPCRYGDVAILFRARTAFPVFERALKQASLPYFVVRGSGFYHQTEIRDMVSFLTVLENPTYDIPLAGILRSPLVGLSDDALLWLGKHARAARDEAPLFSAVRDFERVKALGDEDRSRIRSFLDLFVKLREERHLYGISDLLHRIISYGQYEARVVGQASGPRKVANLRKLVDMARRFEENHVRSSGDFVRYLKEFAVKDVEEAEAQIESEEDDAVRLMTIHQAKGLEFPVVVIADLGYTETDRNDAFATIGDSGCVVMKVRNPKTNEFEDSYSYSCMKKEQARKRQAESKRLFYVAATRAREMLLLSGYAKERERIYETPYGGLSTWAEWIIKATGRLEVTSSGQGHEVNFKGHIIRFITSDYSTPFIPSSRQTFLGDDEKIRHAFLESSNTKKELEAVASDKTSDDGGGRRARFIMDRTKLMRRPFYETVDLPVTALLIYEACPRLFYDRYVLRRPEMRNVNHVAANEREEEEAGGLFTRAEIGVWVHEILETVSFTPRFMRDVDKHLSGLSDSVDGVTRDRLRKICERFYSSPVFNAIAQAKRTVREFPFHLRLRHGTLRGAIDLIYETQEGMLIIADYKTAAVSESDLEDKVSIYKTQLYAYALAARALKRKMPNAIQLVFVNEAFACVRTLPIESAVLEKAEIYVDGILSDIASGSFKVHRAEPCSFCRNPEWCRRAEPESAVVVGY